MVSEGYSTPGGIAVTRSITKIPYARGLRSLMRKLDTQRGAYFSSGYEYPERYSRWDFASVAPPLEIVAAGREIEIRALNPRGEILNRILEPLLSGHLHWEKFSAESNVLRGTLNPLPALFPEEERSKQPSAFSILRTLIDEFRHPLSSRLALVGAFGYDLLFQFDLFPDGGNEAFVDGSASWEPIRKMRFLTSWDTTDGDRNFYFYQDSQDFNALLSQRLNTLKMVPAP